jgi:hypothetical protein
MFWYNGNIFIYEPYNNIMGHFEKEKNQES